MSLQTLPNDILLGILLHFSSWTKDEQANFKQQLNLLGVFQRLRELALPKIYSYVYIIFNLRLSCKRKAYAKKYSKTFAEFADTNTDIITLANCTHMVTSAKIDIDSLSKTHEEFHKIIEALKSCANVWPKITKLEIILNEKRYSIISSKTLAIQPCCSSEVHCQELVKIMPSVTELKLESDPVDGVIGEFYSQVIDVFADQLVKLDVDDFDHINRKKLKGLQYLSMGMGEYDMLPCVNCNTLVDLRIESINSIESWAPFMNSKDGTVLEFPCLKRLSLAFIDEHFAECTDKNIPELQLKFPVLNSLTINFYAEVCSFFKMAVLPNDLKVISDTTQPKMTIYGNEIIMRRS